MRRSGAAAVVALGVCLLVLAAPSGLAAPTALPTHSLPFGVAIPPFLNITYNSSVDHFPLSYAEWLPAGYNGSRHTSLIVYLHGLEGGKGNAVRGGVKSDFMGFLTFSSVEGVTARGLLQNASLAGDIFISLNTRTAGGYYVNSPCGGPQEQDVLDAIAHEKSRHAIAHVYLLGFSMGAIGALSIADHYPKLIKGIAVVGASTDQFEEGNYTEFKALGGASWASGAVTSWNRLTCGNATTSLGMEYHLSSARYDPQNLSGVSIWIVGGGGDLLTPNNASIWPYMEVNNSFVNSTCVTIVGEPANCTTTLRSLHANNSASFSFRMVLEMKAPHNIAMFAPADVFGFWSGRLFGGYFESSYPPTTVVVAPTPP